MPTTIVTGQSSFLKATQASVPASYTAANIASTYAGSLVELDNNPDNPNFLHLFPFHSANNATSVGMRVVGWRRYFQSTDGSVLWVPSILADFTLTYSTGTVPSATVDGGTVYLFSAITQTAGQPAANLYSPATAAATSTEEASVLVDTIGHQAITVQFKSSGTPTMGVFYAAL